MKKRAALLLTAIVCSLGLLQSAHAQGGGCPATAPLFVTQNEVIQTIEFPAISQNLTPTDQPVGEFFGRQVSVSWVAGQRLVVASKCVDDVLIVRNMTTGGEFSRTFASADRMSIEVRDSLVDVTDHLMMAPGENKIVVSYQDLVVDRYSASPVILGVVVGEDLPVEASKGVPVFGNIQPTDTPLPPATATPAPTLTATATTGAPVAAIQPQAPSEAPAEKPLAPAEEKAAANPGLPISWPGWALGLVALALVGIGGLAAVVKNQDRLPGGFKVRRDGVYQADLSPVVLAKYGREMTMGSGKSADVMLLGDDVPPLAVRVELAGEEGRQAVIRYLDPQRPQTVVETRKLVHGQRYVIGPYELLYVNYAQEKQKLDWRNGGGI